MKIIRLGFAILSLAYVAHGATNEAYEITSYFPDKGIVGIKSGAVRTNRPFSSFSSAEQRQITSWLADEEFENSGLSVEIERKKTTNQTSDSSRNGEVDIISYMVTLENRAKMDLRGMQSEAWIFYETLDVTNKAKRCIVTSTNINISSGGILAVETKKVTIRDERTKPTGGSFGTTVNVAMGGSFTVGGSSGPPIEYYTDKLLGMYLCISRKDRNGNIIKKEFEEGRVPDREHWVEYKEPVAKPVRSVASPAIARRPAAPAAADFDIKKLTELAEIGDYLSAYKLCEHYSQKKDLINTVQWAKKTRELIAKFSSNDPDATRILADLDRLEKATQ